MKDNPLVSAVIPSYNRADTLCEAVESVLKQTYSPIEIIVVDDGSTDDTETGIARFGDRISFIRQKHRGTAAARNAGMEASKGEFVAFLDADDLWRPYKTEIQVRHLQSNPHVAILCSDAREFTEKGTFSDSFLSQFGNIQTEGYVFDSVARNAFPLTSTVMIRKDCITNRRFSEKLANFQDIDFFMRLCLRHRMAALRQVLADRRLHEGNVSRNQYNRFLYRTIAFQNILTDGTVLTRRRRRAVKYLLSFSCSKIGDYHWDSYELFDARSWYRRAFGMNRVGLDAFAHFLLTYLPKDSIALLRNLKLALSEKFSY